MGPSVTLTRIVMPGQANARGTLFGGFCMVAGAILAGSRGPWPVWLTLFVVGVAAALHRSDR